MKCVRYAALPALVSSLLALPAVAGNAGPIPVSEPGFMGLLAGGALVALAMIYRRKSK